MLVHKPNKNMKLGFMRWANWAANAGLYSFNKSAEEGCAACQMWKRYQTS